MVEFNIYCRNLGVIMLRTLLFILFIVSLTAVALNFDFFSSSSTIDTITKSSIKKIKIADNEEQVITIKNKTIVLTTESNLSKELQALLNQAQVLYRKGKYDNAIFIYEEVIKKSKNSKELKILKLFAKACLNKANTHYSYPKYDVDSAIESFSLIIEKFENKYNKELLLSYMEARLNQSSLVSKEEIIETYTALIEKFQNDKEKRFEKEVEELLYAKSFALMGVDDEEAIAVLDSIISKYKDKNQSDLPDTVKYSILNNIELSIITSNETDKYVDLANKYMSDLPDTKPLIDMLSIIKDSQELEQNEALERWVEEHQNYAFPDWDFSELRKWVNKMEVPQRQARVREYLDIFEKKKYKNLQKLQNPTVATNEHSKTIDENSEEELALIESDPYMNDILETKSELSYPDPYTVNNNSNLQAEGVSHTYEDD